MNETVKLESLEDICLDYEFIVVDNSVFQGILIDKFHKSVKEKLEHYQIQQKFHKSVKEKLEHYQIQQKSLEFWKENIGDYKNCYTTLKVIEEIRNASHYDYKDIIKKDHSMKKRPDVLKLRRTIKDVCKERNRLIICLEDKQRILEFNREEQNLYKKFYEKYVGFETHYNLHGADFPLFISGAVAAKTRESSAILSNDFGIVRAWNYFLRAENLSREKFGFFVREDISLFKRLRI